MQHMKTMQKCLIVLLAGAMAAVSCNKQPETKSYTITSDITSVSEVAANNPTGSPWDRNGSASTP